MHKVYYINWPGKTEVVIEGDLMTLIPRGVINLFNKGLSGEKTYRIKDIVSVQIKKPRLTNGYIQFGIVGDSSHKQGIYSAVGDENTVMFSQKYYQDMLELKSYIESYKEPSSASYKTSVSEELERVHNLFNKGIINQDELNSAKAKILK